MADDLLAYYNAELARVREAAGAFAEAHNIAPQLRLSRDSVDDPHVERLIEAVAYLTARVRRKIDDDFPELSDAVLRILYPHYARPFPSAAIVQLAAQPDLTAPHTVPAGTRLDTEAVAGTPCRFTSTYDVTLWPLAVREARLADKPYTTPPGVSPRGAGAVLHLTITPTGDAAGLAKLAPDTLRFHLCGAHERTLPLYEVLHNRVLGVAAATGANDPHALALGPEAIAPVGFDADQGLIPYPAAAFSGYRLLTEYFAFPDKFLFTEISGLGGRTRTAAEGASLHIFVFLTGAPKALQRAVSAETFALGCTPVVNLFRQRAEPIRLTGEVSQYRVEPDARRPDHVEIHSLDRVTATNPDGTRTPCRPFHDINHPPADGTPYWLAVGTDAPPGRPGGDVHLALTDRTLAPAGEAETTLSVETTCVNRDLPSRLPFGGGRPRLTVVDGSRAIEQERGPVCLTAPTPTLRPPTGDAARWRLLSHLTLNHRSLMGEGASEAFREILRLYDLRETPETRAAIDAVTSLDGRHGTARVRGRTGPTACRGVDVELTLDPDGFANGGGYLFAAVVQRFLALHVGINGYTRLRARYTGRPGELAAWAPQSGDHPVI